MEYKKYKLKELLTIKNGKDHKQLPEGDYPVYGSGGYMRSVNSFLYDRKSILLPRKGTLSNIQYVSGTPFWTVDTIYYTVLNEKLYDPYYLYLYLNSLDLSGYDSGASIPSMTSKTYYSLNIELPEKKIQTKIANVIRAYDNLIENNNKRIRLLEQMAENLYKEWFVRFRFPGYEDTEFEDGMPRGWVREKIGLHYNTCSGGTPSRTHEEYYTEGTIPWVKTGEIKDGIIIHTDECITEAGIKGSSAKLLPQGAVVMAMYGVNIGMLAYLDSEMTCNQACCVFNDKNEINSRHYLFHYLYSIRDYLLLIGFGAAQQNLSQDLIKKVKIVIPPAELIKEFDKQKEPLYQTIRALMMQNDKLIKQRDALLPRLMSGKLEV